MRTRLRSYLPDILLQSDLSSAPHAQGLSALDALAGLLSYLNIKLEYRRSERERIPVSGSLLVVANHPITSVAGLAALHLLSEVRTDVKLLMPAKEYAHSALSKLILPLGDDRKRTTAALDHLKQGGVLIVFPVRLGSSRARSPLNEERWSLEFLRIAELTRSPILPIHVNVENVQWLKQAAWLIEGITQLLIKRRKIAIEPEHLVLRIGGLISPKAHGDLKLAPKYKAKLLRKQLYRLPKDKPSYFNTLAPVAHPEKKADLQREIKKSKLLGETNDGKRIYLSACEPDSSLIREIGRLREHSFRLVGEGSGQRRDIDSYDCWYQHIVLWDQSESELVGAYRLKQCVAYADVNALYTSTLIDYKPSAAPILERGLELGRSFVQPKYWGSRSLDYLWSGIAAYLKLHPEVRYLFGAVSISGTYSVEAREIIVGYYARYYLTGESVVECKRPFELDQEPQARIDSLFQGLDRRQAFIVLKEQLGLIGHSVPTLYKQYTDLCEEGGVLFHGFNVDPDFQDCIDGLVVVDLNALRHLKRKRYGLLEHDFLAHETKQDVAGANSE